jgi:hypothetical protein
MPSSQETLKISLKYSGQDVDDGSMSVNDFVDAVKGFSSTYGKIATQNRYKHTFDVRITAIEKGSIDIQLAIKFLQDNSALLGDVANFATVAVSTTPVMKGAFKAIQWFIKLFKHTQQQPYTNYFSGNNVVIVNLNNEELSLPSEVYSLLKADEESFKADIYKIVKPLEQGRIDKAIISAKIGDDEISESVTSEEKDFFDPKLVNLTETDRIWITGKFNSLTKSTNKGYFYLPDGSRVSYELKATNPEDMYQYFIYKGVVKVLAKVYLDNNLNKNKIEIFEIEPVQTEMDFDITDENLNE